MSWTGFLSRCVSVGLKAGSNPEGDAYLCKKHTSAGGFRVFRGCGICCGRNSEELPFMPLFAMTAFEKKLEAASKSQRGSLKGKRSGTNEIEGIKPY